MTRPVLLDLFCGEGGAGEGYRRAGFEVVGVDHVSREYRPGRFIEADLTRADVRALARQVGAEAINASPPCTFATAYRRRKGVAAGAVNLIPETRRALEGAGLPYVLENVESARGHLKSPERYCGSSFGLDVRRHRLFETSWDLRGPECDHSHWLRPGAARFPCATNRRNPRRTCEVGAYRIPLAVQRLAMGIDWMPLQALSLAIPPAYTAHIGAQLRGVL